MENGELYKLITEQLNIRIDRLEYTIQHYFDQQDALCKERGIKIDSHSNDIAVINDRHKRGMAIVGFVVMFANSVVSYVMQKVKF